jgi:hypothetical protein
MYHNSGDWAKEIRENNSIEYNVETISLNDLLLHHKAPRNIGYLSIDTEGGEFEILKCFDFSKYRIEIISIEHNNDLMKRDLIYTLLTQKGYERKYKDAFGPDDIYLLNDLF